MGALVLGWKLGAIVSSVGTLRRGAPMKNSRLCSKPSVPKLVGSAPWQPQRDLLQRKSLTEALIAMTTTQNFAADWVIPIVQRVSLRSHVGGLAIFVHPRVPQTISAL